MSQDTDKQPSNIDECDVCTKHRSLMSFAGSLLCSSCVRDAKIHGGFNPDSEEQVIE